MSGTGRPHGMQAMVLTAPRRPLSLQHLPIPVPAPGQVRLRVLACAVCRTDLHVIDGDLPAPALPLVPGHEVVGLIDAVGEGVTLAVGQRVGVPWLGWTCGTCAYCRADAENLCPAARFTGYTLPGGYADYLVADARYCFVLPEGPDAAHAAPLLCAGLIGYRALRLAGVAQRLGFYGFGAAAHLLTQLARWQGRQIYAFTRPGDASAQAFARELGACWAGDSAQAPPQPLDAAILFAPVGALVPAALAAVRPGGAVVCAGIHMSEIPAFPYRLLWQERQLRSVANLTRRDGEAFLALASQVPVRSTVTCYPLAAANQALEDLRTGRLHGAAVLLPTPAGRPAVS